MKKIYINENQINKDLLLPKFLFKAVRAHQTSLGDNPAFPSEDDYAFDYTILKDRYRDVCDKMHELGIPTNIDIEKLKTMLSELVVSCKRMEAPIKDSLEKICENTINRIFAIPEGAVNIKCKLVDKISYKISVSVTPEVSSGNAFKFRDISDFELSKTAIAKRRFINALVMGAAGNMVNLTEYYQDEINKINPELLPLYDKIMTLNEYLLFVTKEQLTDEKPKQGSYVEVYVGGNGKKSTIEAQGIIFPLLLHDTLKGLFELFSVHGLPEDKEKREYIIKKSDFLLAEPWDMRLGVPLWNRIFSRIGEKNIIPYVFMYLIKLPAEEFNQTMKELLMNTERGDEVMNELIAAAQHNDGYQKFKKRINARNVDRAVIADSYFTAAELDGFNIDGEDSDGDVIEEVNEDVSELDHTTYQSAAETAFDRGDDKRVRDFRKQAEREWINSGGYHGNSPGNYDNDEQWITLNNGKQLVIFDNEYQSLEDLVNGVKTGQLLIHARGMAGEITDDMRYIEPCFSETMKEFYGGDYEEIARSKSEYYGEEIEPEYPELIFASDNFSWCNDTRNGVFFIKSDGFQKSLGDGMIQLPNGRICKYWEGEVYDYDNENFRDEPWGVEYGDWYSSQYAEVVAVMNIDRKSNQ